MNIAHPVLSLFVVGSMLWRADWALGLPLIVLTVVVHVFGLLVIDKKIARIDIDFAGHRGYMGMFVAIVGITSLSVALLHGIEGAIWAIAYRLVGALPDSTDAVLYSFGRHDHLWSCECGLRETLAGYGNARSPGWNATVRPHHGHSIRDHPEDAGSPRP